MSGKKNVMMIFGLIVLMMMANCTFFQYKQKIRKTVITDVNLDSLKNGEYYGEYDAYFVAAKVKVMVEDHQIINIELIEHENGRGKAGEKVIPRVLEKQNLEVDTITGATASSKVILKAIELALTEEKEN
jgi:uncharacterized protein with FMN-binding domain